MLHGRERWPRWSRIDLHLASCRRVSCRRRVAAADQLAAGNAPMSGAALAARRLDPLALCAAAPALRLCAHYAAPNIIWPDEVFQVTEPAHRVLFGTGIVTWEWALGIRSWLFPGMAL